MSSRRNRPGYAVVDAALERLIALYEHGDRVVVSTSGGKDSTVITELAIMAARETGNLPVEAVTRDEEIMFPGTYEYLTRLAARTDEIDLHWMIAGQPIINVFDRARPYWWVFDPEEEDRWVRSYPGHGDAPQLPGRDAYWIDEQHIQGMVNLDRFPVDDPAQHRDEDLDKARLVTVIGLRTDESEARYLGLLSSGHHLTKHPQPGGAFKARPVYDWRTGDVWKFISEFSCDYNHSYDAMTRYGRPADKQRIAPPTMSVDSVDELDMASRLWPGWFDRVSARLRGMRTAAAFGRLSVIPHRNLGVSWEQVVKEQILDPGHAPGWIVERIGGVVDYALRHHSRHSTAPLPDVSRCKQCFNPVSCWKKIAVNGYNGDPFGMKFTWLDAIEPEFFREGAGTWGGDPTF